MAGASATVQGDLGSGRPKVVECSRNTKMKLITRASQSDVSRKKGAQDGETRFPVT